MGKRHGWTISEVEALVGLSRRDIQRCCYEGKGGVGILSPEESKWGRRTYTETDLARLFLVAQMKARGMSLPEAKRELDRAAAEGLKDADLLRDYSNRLAEKIEQLETLLLSAQALLYQGERQTLEEIIVTELERTIGKQVDYRDLVKALEANDLHRISSELRLAVLRQLDLPGLALAIDLYMGPQASERLREGLNSLEP